MYVSEMGLESSEFARCQVSGKITLLKELLENMHE
jgi:hypothetical protein